MFLSIINWLLGHAPGFMRPALGWLTTGLRNITTYIANRWNALGGYVVGWHDKVVYWGGIVSRFAYRTYLFTTWIVRVRIPGAISIAVQSAVAYLTGIVAAVESAIMAVVAALKYWTQQAIDVIVEFVHTVKAYAEYWVGRIREFVNNLVSALSHVLSGPQALAEWLLAAMLKALLRYIYVQRDRIFTWLLRESRVFTLWLAKEVEEMIVRIL